MEPNEAIERFMLQLDAQITAANKLNIPEIKLLLNMARLDLQMRLHGISDHELKSLSSMLEHALADNESGKQKVARRKISNKVSLEPRLAVSNGTVAFPNAACEAGQRANSRPLADRRFLAEAAQRSGRFKRRR